MAKKDLIIMIAPSRKQRAEMGPAGYKDSMRPRDGMDIDDDDGTEGAEGEQEGNYTVTIPAHCLSDDESSINPGDHIDFDASGVVKDVTDGKVTLAIKEVNGEACDGADMGDEDESGEQAYDGGGGMGGNTRESIESMGSRLRKKASAIQ